MRDVSGVKDERRLRRHSIHEFNGSGQCPIDVGIGIFMKADVRVADLDKERRAQPGRFVAIRIGRRQVNRGEYSAGEREHRTGTSKGEAFQSVATRRRWWRTRHGALLWITCGKRLVVAPIYSPLPRRPKSALRRVRTPRYRQVAT